jgi:hypothetical protein
VCCEYAVKRRAAKRVKLRWRVSRGVRRSLGWVPFKAASLKRKGVCVRFCGKHLRVFERVRLEQARWRAHRQAARRIHRKLARCRADSLHKFSRSVVERYQKIVVGDVSSPKLARTHMAKAVLDAGWGDSERSCCIKASRPAEAWRSSASDSRRERVRNAGRIAVRRV